MSAQGGWIGVDLDGTLAEYHGWVAPDIIGKPIPLMVDRVKTWLEKGHTVKIFTARASPELTDDIRGLSIPAIEAWCKEHIGVILPITCIKDLKMIELWDDRCVQVVINTGMTIFELEAAKRTEERAARAASGMAKKQPKHQLAPPLPGYGRKR